MSSYIGSILDQESLERAGASLSLCHSRSRQGGVWDKLIEQIPNHQSFGEVRVPADLERLPRGRQLRVVYLVDERGPVLRWLVSEDAEAVRMLGGMFHDDLEGGDGRGQARCGWLLRRDDDAIEMSS